MVIDRFFGIVLVRDWVVPTPNGVRFLHAGHVLMVVVVKTWSRVNAFSSDTWQRICLRFINEYMNTYVYVYIYVYAYRNRLDRWIIADSLRSSHVTDISEVALMETRFWPFRSFWCIVIKQKPNKPHQVHFGRTLTVISMCLSIFIIIFATVFRLKKCDDNSKGFFLVLFSAHQLGLFAHVFNTKIRFFILNTIP